VQKTPHQDVFFHLLSIHVWVYVKYTSWYFYSSIKILSMIFSLEEFRIF